MWHDLAGENGHDHQGQVIKLIDNLVVSNHQVVIIEGSRFDQKAWALCNNEGPLVVKSVVAFVKNIRQNFDRCRILKMAEVCSLPEALSKVIKPDDHYLVQAQFAAEGATIVTTDNPLRSVLHSVGLKCISREEFLELF